MERQVASSKVFIRFVSMFPQNLKEAPLLGFSVICLVTMLVWGSQYGRQIWLDAKVATVALGGGPESLVRVLGKPTEVDQTEGTDIYCYYVGYPFSLVHPEEWQFEFEANKLIRKESTTIRPPW